MLQVRVDLDFPSELIYHLFILELLLGEHLQGNYMLALPLSRQVNMAVPV